MITQLSLCTINGWLELGKNNAISKTLDDKSKALTEVVIDSDNSNFVEEFKLKLQ